MTELERNIQCVKSESLRLEGLMEQSLLMSQNLQSRGSEDVKSLEREMWQLERECRLLSSPSINSAISRSPSPSPVTSQNENSPAGPVGGVAAYIRDELLNTKEELAQLKRQIQQITFSPPQSSPTTFSHSRQSTAEHHHHHYYYHHPVPELSRELSFAQSAKLHDTPIHSKFFRELPTPPTTASSVSTISGRHDRFNSSLSLAWPQDIGLVSPAITEELPGLERTFSHESLLTTTSNPTYLNAISTPILKRSSSHDSIFDPPTVQSSTPEISRLTSPRHSPRSSPLSSSATSSPTYFSASASLRQNTTSSLLLLSPARGKQSRGLSSRKSFWNLWDKTSTPRGQGRGGRSVSASPLGLGERVVVCTEVDVGMLRDALQESC